MKVTLVNHTNNPEVEIGRYAAICYDSKTDVDSCIRRAKSCKDSGHLATLRFAHATFFITGISRTCSHQLVRSKHLDFLQQSQRYVEYKDINYIVPPAILADPDAKELFDNLAAKSRWVYAKLRQLGIKKEDARFSLLEAAPTELYVTGNLQAWADFLKLRADKHAQWEIREVAQEIGRQLAGIAPNIFKEYGQEETTKSSS